MWGLADVLSHDEKDRAACIFEAVRDNLNVDDLSVFLAVFGLPLLATLTNELPDRRLVPVGAQIGCGHVLKFYLRKAVLGDGGVVHLQNLQSFVINDPGGKRIMREEEPEHRFART